MQGENAAIFSVSLRFSGRLDQIEVCTAAHFTSPLFIVRFEVSFGVAF